ncbi:MAG: serine/threonine protein kinase [Acidobacteria bacterium]|nr:serine/threonine protein kinase [Acidobacteriota bacterium]MCB9397862.1 serine/threonine protein kinase [Acidobacteriota bacterium]
MSETSGKTIGRYVVQSLLGEGAMGSVYKAFDPVIRRVVAIKTIKMEQSRTEADQAEFMQRFFQEAQISGILNHPNIVSIYDVGEQDKMPYIAMEYVEGRNLNQIIHSQPRPDTMELAKIIMQVANALEFAHSKGIVHRDLKPGNIMVTPKGMAKIMDFGIAKMSGSHLTQTGVFLGTPSFASPEQIKEGHVDHRSDIFSLGILAHETLTGHTPFPGQSISAILYKIANEPPTPAANLAQLPIDAAKWRAVFDRVFQKDPSKRYQHAAEFGQDLVKCLSITDTERARLGTFMGQIDMTVRDAFGIQKDIQRSEFEMSQAGQPRATRGYAPQPPAQSSSKAGWAVVLLLVLIAGMGGAMQMGVLGDDLKLSALLPLEKVFPPKTLEKSIVLNSNPQGAKITLGEKTTEFLTPYTFKLNGKQGDVTQLKLELEGYKAKVENLVLKEDMETELTLVLELMPINRLITTDPPGATVSVNGKKVGASPIHFEFVPDKIYQIRIDNEGYYPAESNYVEGKDGESKLKFDLRKVMPPGKIQVQTEMEDLDIIVDGQKRTTAFSLPPGSYKLQMQSKRYYFNKTQTVKIESGRSLELSTPPIVTIKKIDMAVGYAKVRVDGYYIRKGNDVEYTPLANLKIAAGTHVFKFEDDNGNILREMTKDVTDGEQIIVDLD